MIGAGRFGRVLRPGRVLPGLGFGLGRRGLRTRPRVIPLLRYRGHLLLRGPLSPGSPGSPGLRGPRLLCGPRLLLGGGLRLPRLRQLRLGLPRGQACLPPVSLGLLGTGLKPGPDLLGRRDLRLEPGPQLGLVPLGVPAGLRHLLLRGPAAPVQLRPSRLGRLPRLSQPRLSLPGLADPGNPCLRGPRLLLGGSLRLPRLAQPLLSLPRRSTRLPRISLGPLRTGLKPSPGLLSRSTRLPRISLGPLRTGLKPGPGLLSRRDLRLKPGPGLLGRRDLRLKPGLQLGLVPLGVPAGPRHLRYLLLRGLRLHAGHRLVPLPPRRRHLLLRGPRLLLGGSLRLPRLAQPLLSLPRRSTRLPRISLGPLRTGLKPSPGLLSRSTRLPRISLGPLRTGLKPGPGLLSRRDLRLKPGPGLLGRRDLRLKPGLQLGLVPLGVPAGPRHLRYLLLRGLRLHAGHRLVPLPPRRRHLLLRGPRLLLGGSLRLPRLAQPLLSLPRRSTRLPRISLGPLRTGLKPSPDLLGPRDLRLKPGPQLGLVPLGVPAGLRHLLLRGPAAPVQLRPSRLGRLQRPRRVLPGLAGPRLGLGRPGLRAAHRLVPLLPGRGHLLPRGPRLLLGGSLRLPRLGQPLLSLCSLVAPPERESRPTRVPRVGRPATLPGQHLAPPERGQRQMRLPGHRLRQPAVPLLCCPRLPRARLILTARIGASEDFLTCLNHR